MEVPFLQFSSAPAPLPRSQQHRLPPDGPKVPGNEVFYGGMVRIVVVMGVAGLVSFACATTTAESERDPRAARYRPGQSLDARLCECRECVAASCCLGEAEDADTPLETELGMALRVCGRCVRRTWTARSDDSCASRAPSECCNGSVVDPALARDSS
jgi:hypothetical protein